MEIIVNDTNIFIDLCSVDLLVQMCELPYRIHTVDFVMAEILDSQQYEAVESLVANGSVKVESFSSEELIEIVNERQP